MKRRFLASVQAAFLILLLSVTIGYSAVNSDLCKYLRVFALINTSEDHSFRYLNGINLILLKPIAYFFSTTSYPILLYGLLCSVLYLLSTLFLANRRILPINKLSKFVLISLLLLINPLSSNISGLFRSYLASLLAVIGIGIRRCTICSMLLIISISLQPLTVIPTLLVNYIPQISTRLRISVSKVTKFKLNAYLKTTVMLLVPIYLVARIYLKDFSYPELMLYLVIFSAIFALPNSYCKNQSKLTFSRASSLFNRSGAAITLLAMIASWHNPDAYRILFPVGILATAYLISEVVNFNISINSTSSRLLPIILVLSILTLPLYIMNYRKVYMVTDDALCDLINDSLIRIVPSN